MSDTQRYRSPDVVFEVPKDWEDHTIMAAAGPAAKGELPPTFVVTKLPMRKNEWLRTYADRQMLELAEMLDDFELLEMTEEPVSGLPAVRLRFRWVSAQGPLEQHIAMVERGGIVTHLTSTAPQKEAAKLREVFHTVLSSVRVLHA